MDNTKHKGYFLTLQALKIAHSLPTRALSLHSIQTLFYIHCFILFPLQSSQVNIIGPMIRMKTSSLGEVQKTWQLARTNLWSKKLPLGAESGWIGVEPGHEWGRREVVQVRDDDARNMAVFVGIEKRGGVWYLFRGKVNRSWSWVVVPVRGERILLPGELSGWRTGTSDEPWGKKELVGPPCWDVWV